MFLQLARIKIMQDFKELLSGAKKMEKKLYA